MSKDKTSFISTNDKEIFETKISLDDMCYFVSNIEGRILTVIDASITEPKQKEAVKSLIRQFVWKDFDRVRDWFYGQDIKNGIAGSFPFGPQSSPEIG